MTHEEACYSIELKHEAILAVLTEQERQWDADAGVEAGPELIAAAYIEWTIENLEEAQERAMEDQQDIEPYLQEDRQQWYELCRQLQEQKERHQQEERAEKKKKQQQQLHQQPNEENSSTMDIPPPRKIRSLILHRPTIQPQGAPQFRQPSAGNSAGAVGGRRGMLQRASSQRFCTRMEALQPLRQASMRQLHSQRQAFMRHIMDRNATYEYDSATTLTNDDHKNMVNNSTTNIKESSLAHLMARDSLLYNRPQLPRHLSCPRKLGHEPNALRNMLLATWE